MAVLTLTLGKSGVNSAAYRTSAASAGADTIANAQLVAGLAAGQLKTFLSATYADAAAANLAWVNIGGNASCSNVSQWVWVATASTPSLAVTSVAAATCALRLSTSYSASA